MNASVELRRKDGTESARTNEPKVEPDRHGHRAQILALLVAEEIARLVRPGLGRWGPAWELVAEPSDAFLDALSAWKESGLSADLRAVKKTAAELIAAWADADRRALESGWHASSRHDPAAR